MTEENKNLNDTTETFVKNDVIEETLVDKEEIVDEAASLSNKQEFKEVRKESMSKNIVSIFTDKKKMGILAVAMIAIFILFSVINGPKSVINDVKVSFSGYDERGTATYNEVEVKAKIAKIIAEKNGIKAPDVSNASNASASLNDILKNLVSGNTEYYKKLGTIEQQYSSVVISLDKTSNLKNGDTVTVTIKAGNNSPIKSETKTFTVSDLKPITKVDAESVLSENAVVSTGYNGYGTLKYDSNIYAISESGTKNLKNGQKVDVKIKDAYIKKLLDEGKIFDGNASTIVEVNGLKELNTIKNLSDLYTSVSDLAKSKYANTNGSSYTYTIEKKNDFMKYTTSSSKEFISAVSVYKVNEKYTGFSGDKTEEYYAIVGYSNLEIFDNSVILADLQYKTYSNSSKYTNEDSANAYLKSQGFIEYKR